MYGNAKSYLITAKSAMSLTALLASFFKTGEVAYRLAITGGGVWIGSERVKDPEAQVKAKQTVRVFISPTQEVVYQLSRESVVYESKDLIAVLKPAGLSTVPDRACDRFNLTAALGRYLRDNGCRYVPTAISRLDLMVSGVVLFAKSKDAEKELFAKMRDRKIHKLYRAKVRSGGECRPILTVNAPISFEQGAVLDPLGKESKTVFLFESHDTDGDWYRAIPVTGRRHQIRIHAKLTIGPIMGDPLYGGVAGPEIALMSIGYNLDWKNQKIRIRYAGAPIPPIRMGETMIEGVGVAPRKSSESPKK